MVSSKTDAPLKLEWLHGWPIEPMARSIRWISSFWNIGTDWPPIVIDCRLFWLSYNRPQLCVADVSVKLNPTRTLYTHLIPTFDPKIPSYFKAILSSTSMQSKAFCRISTHGSEQRGTCRASRTPNFENRSPWMRKQWSIIHKRSIPIHSSWIHSFIHSENWYSASPK